MISQVKREGDKVWIEGVDELAGWGKGEENTFMGSLRVALSAVGENVSYDQLMGVSGAAFRLQIAQPNWCPSAPDATVGFDVSGPAVKALGYSLKTIDDNSLLVWTGIKRIRAAIVESIDEGRPVVAINLAGGMDWGVITGYEDKGKSFLCRTYDEYADEYVIAKECPCVIEMPAKTGKVPDWIDSILESLRIAVKLAHTKSFDGYASGFTAYEVWIRDLLDDARYDKLNRRKLNEMIQPNAWCYYSLYDARAVAARYLGSVEKEFKEEVAGHLSQAEKLYGQVVDMLLAGQKHAPFPHQLKGKPWTKEMRHAQAKVLKAVSALEKTAVGELETAVLLDLAG